MELRGGVLIELADVAVFAGYMLVIGVGAMVGGFLANLFYGFYGYNSIHNRVLSLENGIRGAKGVSARVEKEGRMALAIAEGAELMKNGSTPVEVLAALGPKYPDVALDLVKKFKKEGLEGLM